MRCADDIVRTHAVCVAVCVSVCGVVYVAVCFAALVAASQDTTEVR